jgi:hypothetical protein
VASWGRRARSPRHVAGAVACAALLLAFVVPSAAGASGGALPNAVSTASGTWAVVPMGQLAEPSNSFWQLLVARQGSPGWSVATPPGVADNGGLVLGAGQDSVLVGFLPSGRLQFSPLALSHDGGATWHPSYLPGALADVPDALAFEPGPSGGALAVLRAQHVVASGATLSSWASKTSQAQLRRSSPACRAGAITAVAFSPSGSTVVGARCTRPGVVGIFTQVGSSWLAARTASSQPFPGGAMTVLRLETLGQTTVALAQVVGGRQRALVALWNGADGWSSSAPLALGSGASVRASAIGANGSLAVLVAGRGGLEAHEISPGSTWVPLPTPPTGTQALATAPNAVASFAGGYDALSVHGAVLRVFALTPARTRWIVAQTLRVPLAYGSSG